MVVGLAFGRGRRRPVMTRRFTLVLVGAAIAALMLGLAGMASAQEVEEPASTNLNPTPDDTWMTNGIVYSIIRSGDYIYVGGKFTRVRSAASGGNSFAATNLARFHADTGVGDPTWTPDVTGADMTITTVYALAAAGGNVWIGGKFDAVSEVTGAVDPNIDPLVGLETNATQGVRALLGSETKVYVGGIFPTIDG